MRIESRLSRIAASTTAALCLLGGGREVLAQPATPLGEIVLYGIDADTHELLRYTFGSDTYTRIGVVVDQNGFEIDHPEGFTYIPSGEYKGFYAVSQGKDDTDGPHHTLARINGMDATCVMYPQQIRGNAQIRGMTTVPDGVGGWRMLAISNALWTEEDPPRTDILLIEIHPETGLYTTLWDLSAIWPNLGLNSGAGVSWEGLSRHPDPNKLFLMTGYQMVEFDLTDGSYQLIGDHSPISRTESLEIVFGDLDQRITIPGVPATWTNQGALFGFSDNLDVLVVFNVASLLDGDTVADYQQYNCSFDTVDCEGIVFMTQLQDPYGKIVVEACD